MNFSEMHERLRLQLMHRIQRGSASISLLARQTGIGTSHLSNFLHRKRQLSLEAADRVMAAQHISAADLLTSSEQRSSVSEESAMVPVVSHGAAMHEPYIRPGAVLEWVHLPQRLLRSARAQPSVRQKAWQRFVAVAIAADEAARMHPVVSPGAILLLDRHYNSLTPYEAGRQTLYGVRAGHLLKIRYVTLAQHQLVLRPQILDSPLEYIDVEEDCSPRDAIAGRVVMVMNEV
ncbi:MAG: hypothetical protein ACLGSD_01480 [Acidobacteriota bacterium]